MGSAEESAERARVAKMETAEKENILVCKDCGVLKSVGGWCEVLERENELGALTGCQWGRDEKFGEALYGNAGRCEGGPVACARVSRTQRGSSRSQFWVPVSLGLLGGNMQG